MFPADDDRADNVIDPSMLAERRAKRAEMSEERLNAELIEAQRLNDRLQGRADALSGELEIARDRRDEIAQRIEALQRELRVAQQREHAERQLRIEIQDELAQAGRDAVAERDALRSEVREAHQRTDEIQRELHHRVRDLDHSDGLIERHEAARARAEAAAAEHEARLTPLVSELDEVRSELERREALQSAFEAQVAAFRDNLETLRERHETDAARQELAQAALRDVIEAAGRMRVRLDQAQLLRAEAQERLAQTREQLDERDAEVVRLRRDLETTTVEVGTLRAQLQSEGARAVSALDAAGDGVRSQLAEQAASYEATLAELRAQLQSAFEAQPGAPTGPSPREADLLETVARLTGEIRRLREKADGQVRRAGEMAALVAEIIATARDVRAGYQRELDQVQTQIDAERDVHNEGRARLEAQLAAQAEAAPAAPEPAVVGAEPAAAEAVIAGLARAEQRLRAAAEPPAGEAAAEDEPQWEPFTPQPWAPAKASPWMTGALVALAQRDGASAAEILVALLALQGRSGRSVLYDLTVVGTGTWRITVHDRVVDVVRDARRAFDGAAAFHVTGPVEDLAVLAGGGRGGLGSGARVSGSKRQARKLLRANRQPVGLTDATLLLDPGQALALLAAAHTPGGLATPPLAVDLVTPAGETWHARVDGGVLRTGTGPVPRGNGAQATLRGSRADLVTVLGGGSSQGLTIAGDPDVAHALANWLKAIQKI